MRVTFEPVCNEVPSREALEARVRCGGMLIGQVCRFAVYPVRVRVLSNRALLLKQCVELGGYRVLAGGANDLIFTLAILKKQKQGD